MRRRSARVRCRSDASTSPVKLVDVASSNSTFTRSPGAAVGGKFTGLWPAGAPHDGPRVAAGWARSTITSTVRPDQRLVALSRPMRWTSSTSRAMRSSATAASHPPGSSRRRGLAAGRIHEGEGAVEAALLHQGQRVREILLCLPGKAHDQVGGEGQTGNGLAQLLDQIQITRTVVAPPHGRQDAVAPRLHRQVEVLAHLVVFAPSARSDPAGHILGMRGHEAHPFHARDTAHAVSQQPGEVGSRPGTPGSLP